MDPISDATANSNGVNGNASEQPYRYGQPRPKSWVPLYKESLGTPTRKLRMVATGAGFAGLQLAHTVYNEQRLTDLVDFTIYEANEDIGGTWLVNHYPGVASDIPAHIYTFPFEPNPDWSAFYASGAEIHAYIKRTAKKYDLTRGVKLNHRLIHAKFDEIKCQWDLKIQNKDGVIEDTCDILVSANGHLSRWKWPSIVGLHSFQGDLIHSAEWSHNIDYTGKRVAVIGNGSSAIQIVPQMTEVAGQVTNFIRAATWIIPGLGSKVIDGKINYVYSEEEKARFRENPEALKGYRKKIQQQSNMLFSVFQKNSPAQVAASEGARQLMHDRLGGDEELAKKLIPDWEVGCRRPTPGPGYLESFQEPHVSLIDSPIEKITPTGMTTSDGKHHEFDVIVCATGFDVSHKPPFPVLGRDGVSLSEKWDKYPEAYLSLCVDGFPNFFMFSGPNAPVGHGSLLAVMSWSSDYITQWLRKMAKEDIKWIEVKKEVVSEFNTYADEILQTLVWTGGCRSWFKNNTIDGKVIAVWAGSALHYKEMIDTIRPEDFILKRRSANRFRFIGNGRTKRETIPNADLAFYLEK